MTTLRDSSVPIVLVVIGTVKPDSAIDTLLCQHGLDLTVALQDTPRRSSPIVLFTRPPQTLKSTPIFAIANLRYRLPLPLALEYAFFAFAHTLSCQYLLIVESGIRLDDRNAVDTLCDYASRGVSIPVIEPATSHAHIWWGSALSLNTSKIATWMQRPRMVFDTLMGNANTSLFPLCAWSKEHLSKHLLRS
jgi:hypothetical protein